MDLIEAIIIFFRSYLAYGLISVTFCWLTGEYKHPRFTKEVYLKSFVASFGPAYSTEIIARLLSESYLPLLKQDPLAFGWGYLGLSIGLFLLSYDFLTYWIHRGFHLPLFYKRFHAYHHQFSPVTSAAAASAQFLDGILLGQVPIWASVIFLELVFHGISLITLSSLFAIIGIYSLYLHSIKRHTLKNGWLIDNRDHLSHHGFTTVNYSSLFRFWDVLAGTYKY